MPKWLEIAKSYLGTREVVGPKHSAVILGWIKRLGAAVLGVAPKDDETPWCGTFAAEVMSEAGFTPPKIAIRASSWATWGVGLKAGTPGAILVFQRPGGGHVGFYVAETKTAFKVRGGNQSNAVTDTWIDKARCIAIRWPAGIPLPTFGPVLVSTSGVPLSKNEA